MLVGFGRLPLHEAVRLGRSDETQDLISAGASIDGRDVFGSTPLHIAAWVGHDAAVAALLAQGACAHARRLDGRSPLVLAKIRAADLDDAPSLEGLPETALLRGNWRRVAELLRAAPGAIEDEEELEVGKSDALRLELNQFSWNSSATASTRAPEDEGDEDAGDMAGGLVSLRPRSLKELSWPPELPGPQSAAATR